MKIQFMKKENLNLCKLINCNILEKDNNYA